MIEETDQPLIESVNGEATTASEPEATSPGHQDPETCRWPWRVLAMTAAALFVILTVHAAWLATPTVDEFAHVPAGAAYICYGRFELYSKNPPLGQILTGLPPVLSGHAQVPQPEGLDFLTGWGPWIYANRFMLLNTTHYFRLFFLARLPVIVLGLLTGLLIFLWARDVFGERAAAIVTALFYLSPLVLAHSHLATVDVASMCTILLAVYALRWACGRGGMWRLVLAGCALGAALLVKFTAVLLAPVVCCLVLVYRRKKRGWGGPDVCIYFAIALLTVNAGMAFRGTGKKLGDYTFVSSFAGTLQRILPASLPVPLPEHYVSGFDAVKRDTERGEFGTYLLGRWSQQGWWYYNLVALAVKVPFPLLLMILACPLTLLRRRLPPRESLSIAIPLVTLMLLLTFFNRVSIGIRYLLPVYPFFFLGVASLWAGLGERTARIGAGLVLGYYLLMVLAIHPNHLTYFNLAAGGPGRGHRVLADSNIDWGQDLYRLKPALDRLGHRGKVKLLYFGHVHPSLYGIDYELAPDKPVRDVVAVSVNYLVGYPYPALAPDGTVVAIRPDHIEWLRAHEPVAKAGTIWIFDTREPDDRQAPAP